MADIIFMIAVVMLLAYVVFVFIRFALGSPAGADELNPEERRHREFQPFCGTG
jgi:hypothetical protein